MIDEESILHNLEDFSFPRLSGTIHEKNALDMAFKKILDLGLKANVQEFEFSTFYSRTYPKIAFFSGFLLIFSFFIDLRMGIISSMILVPILVFLFIIMRTPENVMLPKKLDSANLFVRLKIKRNNSKKSSNSRKRIVFSCHLDSKGQRLTILARIKSMKTWFFSSIIMIFFIILKYSTGNDFIIIFNLLGTVPMTLISLSTIFILLNTTNNDSIGSIDNASGIACVLELLKYYSTESNRLENLEFWFVFTGCEETGTMGIRNLYNKFKFFKKESLMLVNFDAIGKSVTIFDSIFQPEGYRDFYHSFLTNKNNLDIQEESKRINFGTHSDGTYLKKKNYQGIEFGDKNSYKYLHSNEDTLDKVDTRNLKELCELIVENLKHYYENM